MRNRRTFLFICEIRLKKQVVWRQCANEFGNSNGIDDNVVAILIDCMPKLKKINFLSSDNIFTLFYYLTKN